ncbi:LLM class flavin-dependent oxidoreductase [Lipingzhangella halophila]|uniref:LLM class flavin-dependent oxidoreductase n=1 Tax=Lipingzhangella halophila TaxID=1783352 RepID=UPI001C88B08A|nr:LLM class flavin-dependent oxidoreductase [Lipingzhangella halophila]
MDVRAAAVADGAGVDGRHYAIAQSRVNPKPVQQGGPPTLVGAAAPASTRRTAQLGLGLHPVMVTWDTLENAITTFREAGHEPGSLPVVLRVNFPLTDRPVDQHGPLAGSAEQVTEDLPRLEALRINEVFWSMDHPRSSRARSSNAWRSSCAPPGRLRRASPWSSSQPPTGDKMARYPCCVRGRVGDVFRAAPTNQGIPAC